jgi:hypothetical protein
VQFITEWKINVVAFDFVGCQGNNLEYFSYGIKSVFDVRDILQEVRKYTRVGRITLWGRNMGALCAMMFA